MAREAMALAGGGALADDGKNESGKGREGWSQKDDKGSRKDSRQGGHDYFRQHQAQLRIPNGHLPFALRLIAPSIKRVESRRGGAP